MIKIYIYQLLTSFILGGATIAALSIIAERAPTKIAGIIISIPSTIAISLFFMSWTLGPEKMPEVIAVIPTSMGFGIIFTITWLYLSKIRLPKILSILLCQIGAIGIWLSLAFSVSKIKIPNIWTGTLIYFGFLAIGYYFLTYRPKETEKPKTQKYSIGEKLFRAIFAGSIITLAVHLAKVAGPIWGGIFSTFPAVFTSTLTILHLNYDSKFLFRTFRNIPMGFIPMITFVLASFYTFPLFGTIFGLLAAYGITLLIFVPMVLRK